MSVKFLHKGKWDDDGDDNYMKQGTRMWTGIIWPKVETCGWVF